MSTSLRHDAEPQTTGVELSSEPTELELSESTRRFPVSNPSPRLRLSARTADRTVLARLERAVTVPAHEETRVFLAAPLWVRLDYGPDERLLTEIAMNQLSEGWLGPSTMVGELAYVLQVPCRTDPSHPAIGRNRCLTAAHIENRAALPLELTRFSLPLPRLRLYQHDGIHWTQDVRLVRALGDDVAELEISPGPPAEAPTAREVAAPRDPPVEPRVTRVFSHLFH